MKTMNKEQEEFTRLVQEHKSTIYTVCYMFSHDEDEVNDLFQETLINMWKGMEGFRIGVFEKGYEIKNPGAWDSGVIKQSPDFKGEILKEGFFDLSGF